MNRLTLALIIFSPFSFPNPLLATGDWAEAPKGLDHYVDRLPAKSLAQLIQEKDGRPDTNNEYQLQASGIDWRIGRILEDAEKALRAEAVKSCENLLKDLRQSPAIAPAWTNLVHDLKDCLADSKTANAEAADYCRWRFELGDISGVLSKQQLADLEQRRLTAKGRTAAHYLYLTGANHYFGGDEASESGRKNFAAVAEGFPDHPRAETALFMTGRAALANVGGGWGEPPSPEGLDIAESAFRDYLKHFPEGRFVGDVYGWLGAVEVKREAFAKAFSWYLRQLEVTDHPENIRSATRMVERVMAIVLARKDEAPIKEIAARPKVAMGTVYWIIHAPEANIYNGFFDHPEVVKRWRSHWLPRLANAVRQNEAVWRDHDAMPWFVAIQAHAASDAGNQKEALALVDSEAGLLDASDDLSFIRAVILQRSGDAGGAVAAYRNFLADFPGSPLRRGSVFRLATAYQDAGKSDDAVAVLLQLAKSTGHGTDNETDKSNYFNASFYPGFYGNLPAAASALSPDISTAEPGQVRQYIDTLLQFAPIKELAGLKDMQSAIDPTYWEKIRITLLGRALSKGLPEIAADFTGRKESQLARHIAELAKAANSNPSGATYLELGNAWKNARGKLTSPALQSDRRSIYIEDSTEAPEVLRMKNAGAIGFAEGSADRVLQMDELWNAVQAWEKAIDSSEAGSPLRAQALSSVLEALPGIAMASPYARRFAVEHDWNGWASKRYRQLMGSFPGSPEAIAAARPFFRIRDENENGNGNSEGDPATADPFDQISPGWTARLFGFHQNYIRHREFLYGSLLDSDGLNQRGFGSGRDAYQKLLNELYQINGDLPLAELKEQMEPLRQKSRQIYRHFNDACIHYAIEDLADFVSQNNPPGSKARSRYFIIRRHAINVMAWHSGIRFQPVDPKIRATGGPEVDDLVEKEVVEALSDPELKSLYDRLECLRLYILANRQYSLPVKNIPDRMDPGETTIETRDYAEVEKEAKRFLETYRNSPKREQVWLLYLRAAYRSRRPLLYSAAADFPENPFIASSYIRKTHPNQIPWDPKPVENAIQAYLSEYDKPTYLGELHDLQAALAFRKKDWSSTISHTLTILQNKEFADLHHDSLIRLSNLFALLANHEDRSAVLSTIKSNPVALGYLKQYLDATDENSWGMTPLHFLSAWVREQIGVPKIATVEAR